MVFKTALKITAIILAFYGIVVVAAIIIGGLALMLKYRAFLMIGLLTFAIGYLIIWSTGLSVKSNKKFKLVAVPEEEE